MFRFPSSFPERKRRILPKGEPKKTTTTANTSPAPPRNFHAVKEAGEIPPGLDLPMCLMVDSESLASINDPKSTTPFLLAVDTHYDPDHPQKLDHVCENGHFKVAISSLMPDLYPSLASGAFTSARLKPFANPVFTNAYGL